MYVCILCVNLAITACYYAILHKRLRIDERKPTQQQKRERERREIILIINGWTRMNCEAKWIIVSPEMLGIHFDLIINSENVLANKEMYQNEHKVFLLLSVVAVVWCCCYCYCCHHCRRHRVFFSAFVVHLILFLFDVTNGMQ